jgi:AcrR family transcriptional regulator
VPKQRLARGASGPKKPRTQPERAAPASPARREEVLEAALELIAEHGVAGASLRMLARRLGMSQPSLYHYFPSKDQLISAILDHSTQRMLGAGSSVPPPRSVDDAARFVRDAVLELYATESHPRFVRFLFSVAVESKKHRPLVERLFEERLRPSFGVLAQMLAATPAEQDYVHEVMRMVVYSLGFMLLDERALLAHPAPSASTLRYSEWVLDAANRLLATRPR